MMTRVFLLEQLRDFTKANTKDILMPVRCQKEDGGQPPDPRAADVYLMRLPDSKADKKKAPYILHQAVTSKDIQPSGQREGGRTVVRSVFCVYEDNEQEGALTLLNLMERLRVALLKQGVIGKQFQLDLEDGLETLIYPDETAPYYLGEMISTWIMPGIKRR